MSKSYHRAPLARTLPTLPIPGETLANDGTGRALPAYVGSTQSSVCKFWSVVYEMNWHYFFEKNVQLPTAESIYHKLLAWSDQIPQDVRRNDNSLDHAIGLQYALIAIVAFSANLLKHLVSYGHN